MSSQRFLLGMFEDEKLLLAAVKSLLGRGVKLHDVYTPYAIHGLDEAMGLKRSRLPIVCFMAGTVGLLIGVLFQTWVFTSSWPINIGGKPFFALPAFIPVTFEMTVLVAGLVSVAAFFIRSGLYPGAKARLVDSGITDDTFVIAVALADASVNKSAVGDFFKNAGAIRVAEKEVTS